MVGCEIGCEHLLNRWFESVRAGQDDRAAVREMDSATAVTVGRQAPAEVLAEDKLGRMTRRKIAAVHGDQRALRA